MKLKIIDENNFILSIIDQKKIPSVDETEIGEYLKKVFLDINSKYNIDVYGYYDVTIYKDEFYGMIIKLVREELEYISYYDKQIEMKIILSDDKILYKINNLYMIDKRIYDKSEKYLYNNEIYLFLKEKIDFVLLGTLIENSEIIFEGTNEIKANSEKIGW